METDSKINLDAPDLLVANFEAVKQAIRQGISQALLSHKLLDNPVAIQRGGKVILIAASELLSEKNQIEE